MGISRWVVPPIAVVAVVLAMSGCGGGSQNDVAYEAVTYDQLAANLEQLSANEQPIQIRGQVVELIESADYTELGDPAGPNAPVVFTIESFLLNAGRPLPRGTLRRLHRAFESDGVWGDDAGKILKGEDLELVLVRWAAPPDIPQRAAPGADPYPVTPGSAVTVQGVVTSDRVGTWRHCRTYKGPYGAHIPCTNLRGASGPQVEAANVAGIESAQFGTADGPPGD